MGVTIRAARTDDIEMLQDIERRAGARFRDVGLADIADAEPFSAQELIEFIDAGRAWVAGDEPLGYAVATVVDGDGHLEQISVDPEHQGAGLGRALVDRVCDWARTNGAHAVTLTTFTDVSWNRPLYEHLGFAVIPEGDIRPELRAVRDHEAELGLDPAQRVCMLRNLA